MIIGPKAQIPRLVFSIAPCGNVSANIALASRVTPSVDGRASLSERRADGRRRARSARRLAPRRPAVMADVGRLAGVSHQTVSRVINGSPHVRPSTRDRVLAAMRELGYRPNSVARALVTGRSQDPRRGQLRHDPVRPGLDPLRDRAGRPRGRLLHRRRQPEDAGPRSSIVAVERLRRHGVDGILVIAPTRGGRRRCCTRPAEFPLVAVEAGPDARRPGGRRRPVRRGGAATRHLLDLGHDTVWHVAGPADFLEAQQRERAWRETPARRPARRPPRR